MGGSGLKERAEQRSRHWKDSVFAGQREQWRACGAGQGCLQGQVMRGGRGGFWVLVGSVTGGSGFGASGCPAGAAGQGQAFWDTRGSNQLTAAHPASSCWDCEPSTRLGLLPSGLLLVSGRWEECLQLWWWWAWRGASLHIGSGSGGSGGGQADSRDQVGVRGLFPSHDSSLAPSGQVRVLQRGWEREGPHQPAHG